MYGLATGSGCASMSRKQSDDQLTCHCTPEDARSSRLACYVQSIMAEFWSHYYDFQKSYHW